MEKTPKSKKELIWENLQVLTLALTIAGQALVGGLYLVAQCVWLIANVIAFSRNFILQRPLADKIKDGAMCGLTSALIILRVAGIY